MTEEAPAGFARTDTGRQDHLEREDADRRHRQATKGQAGRYIL